VTGPVGGYGAHGRFFGFHGKTTFFGREGPARCPFAKWTYRAGSPTKRPVGGYALIKRKELIKKPHRGAYTKVHLTRFDETDTATDTASSANNKERHRQQQGDIPNNKETMAEVQEPLHRRSQQIACGNVGCRRTVMSCFVHRANWETFCTRCDLRDSVQRHIPSWWNKISKSNKIKKKICSTVYAVGRVREVT
jgi:hypothetical protein